VHDMITCGRRGLAASLVAGCSVLLPLTGHAQAVPWPARNIRIITPTAPGSSTDYFARGFAQYLQAQTGQGVFVDNKPGGNTMIGTEAAKNASPDGYTFFVGSVSTHSLNPVIQTKLSYDPAKDFVEVGMFSVFPYYLVVAKSSPWGSAADLIEAAKSKPHKVSCGYSSAASRVPCELLKVKQGLDLLPVAYKSAPAVLNDLASGTIDFTIMDAMSTMTAIKGGLLRPVAVTSASRSPLLPDVKTLAETVPGVVFEGWAGLTAPAGTPKPVLERMNQYLRGALAEGSEFRRNIEQNGGTVRITSLAEQADWVAADRQRWREWVKLANIPAE
jgi:tripartite-type tricarboxylate transporter receptor subunit TctC